MELFDLPACTNVPSATRPEPELVFILKSADVQSFPSEESARGGSIPRINALGGER